MDNILVPEEFRRFVTPTAPSFRTSSVYLRSLSPRALNKAAPSCLAAPGVANPSAVSTPHSDIDGKLSSLADRESTCQHLDGAFVFCGNGHVHVAIWCCILLRLPPLCTPWQGFSQVPQPVNLPERGHAARCLPNVYRRIHIWTL